MTTLKAITLFLGSFLTTLYAQQVQITGTVKDDSTNLAISGALVKVVEANLSATTDAQGAFTIAGTVTSLFGKDKHLSPRLTGSGRLAFTVVTEQPVSLTVRSFDGKSIYRMEKRVTPGRCRVVLPISDRGVHLYELRLGNQTYTLKQMNLSANGVAKPSFTHEASSAESYLSKRTPAAPTLQASHPAYKLATLPIDNYQAKGVNIRLIKKGPVDTSFTLPDPDKTPPLTNKPVKVFIMSGQSNMVGFGKIDGAQLSTRWDSKKMFRAAAPDTAIGGVVSVYAGAYSSTANYDQMTPISTAIVANLGGTSSDPFPTGGTRVLRGYMESPVTGLYIFKPGYEASTVNIMKVNGVEVHRKEVGGKSVFTPMQLQTGTRYSYSVVYLTNAADGYGWIELGGMLPGTLVNITSPEGGGMFPQLLDDKGEWTVRSDVWYRGVVSAFGDGPLTPGFGASKGFFGPELGFGYVMGQYLDEPVLLIKSSIGNRSLSWDIAPPNTKRFTYDTMTYAGYGDSINVWPTAKGYEWYRDNGCKPERKFKETGNCFAPWYCGFEYDRFFNTADSVLVDFGNHYPQWKAQGFEIAGFVWWQGHKDQGAPHDARYEQNMANLIRMLRERWKLPKLPVVLATVAFDGGWNGTESQKIIANGQLAMNNWVKYPDFANSVKAVEARDYWRDKSVSPSSVGFHYNHNAETYYKVGHSLGMAMKELLGK